MNRNRKARCGLMSTAIIMAILVPANLPADGTSFEAIDEYLEGRLGSLNIPGAALAVVEGGELVHFQGFGKARPDGGRPSPETPFIIGSLTKSFTAMAVMQLVEEGKVDLDAPVQEYVPWFETAEAAAAGAMTVRNLLNQTSGLPMLEGLRVLAVFDDSPDAHENRVRELADFSPRRAPGEAFEYSNLNYDLLGLIVEAASDEDYGDYIEGRVFEPLGMVHSHSSHKEAAHDGVAMGHTLFFGLPLAQPDLPRPIGSTPSGQLVSSAADMARYLAAVSGGGELDGTRILSREGIAELLRPATDASSMGVDMGDYAMGWFVDAVGGQTLIWHDGTVPDFFSYMALLPERDTGLILLVNANHMIVNFSLLEMAETAVAILVGEPAGTAKESELYVILRLFLLIPLAQILGIALMVARVRRWRADPAKRPHRAALVWFHIIPASILHLLAFGSAIGLHASGMAPFLMLFMPDIAGLVLIVGGVSLIWGIARIPLLLLASKDARSAVREAKRDIA